MSVSAVVVVDGSPAQHFAVQEDKGEEISKQIREVGKQVNDYLTGKMREAKMDVSAGRRMIDCKVQLTPVLRVWEDGGRFGGFWRRVGWLCTTTREREGGGESKIGQRMDEWTE